MFQPLAQHIRHSSTLPAGPFLARVHWPLMPGTLEITSDQGHYSLVYYCTTMALSLLPSQEASCSAVPCCLNEEKLNSLEFPCSKQGKVTPRALQHYDRNWFQMKGWANSWSRGAEAVFDASRPFSSFFSLSFPAIVCLPHCFLPFQESGMRSWQSDRVLARNEWKLSGAGWEREEREEVKWTLYNHTSSITRHSPESGAQGEQEKVKPKRGGIILEKPWVSCMRWKHRLYKVS